MPLLGQVLDKYPSQVKLVFKNFPLSSHKYARDAAVAAMAAQRQGTFWPYHDALFAHYNQLNQQKIEELAGQVGLDMEQFNRDRRDPALMRKVQEDFREGVQAGVRGTPTIFINGRRLKQRSMRGFSALIEDELKKAANSENLDP